MVRRVEADEFRHDALYELLVDTDGDARPDRSFRIRFTRKHAGQQFGRVTLAQIGGELPGHHEPDRRLPGFGLGFSRDDLGGQRVVSHDGGFPGFSTAMTAMPGALYRTASAAGRIRNVAAQQH